MGNIRESTDKDTPVSTTEQDSRDYLALALNDHAIVSIADRAGRILYVNDTFCEISGYSREELMGNNHRMIKSDVHPPEFYRAMWQTISGGKLWRGEICNRRKNGEPYWVESTITPIHDERGRPDHYISIRTDITRQKLAEKQLTRHNLLQERLTWTAKNLLACSNDDTEAAIHDAIKGSETQWDCDLISILIHRDAPGDPSAAFSCHSREVGAEDSAALKYAILTEVYEVSPPGIMVITQPLLSSGPLAELDHFIVSPLYINDQYKGALAFARRGDNQEWHNQYDSFIALLSELITHALRRQCMTEELFHSKERLRRGQIYANIGTWDWHIQTGELFWSERIAPLFGYPNGELETTYENFLNAVHPDDRPRVSDAVHQAVHNGAPYEIEHRVVWPNGTTRWVMEKGSVYRDEQGQPLQMLGVVQDIDERKRAELALEEHQDQLQRSQEIARLATIRVDLLTGTIKHSDNLADVINLDMSDRPITPGDLRDIVHPADQHIADRILSELSRTGRYNTSHRIIGKDGTIRHVSVIGEAVRLTKGSVTEFAGAIQDITHRVELEKRLRDTEQRFVFAVEGAGDGVWDWDINENLVEYSLIFARMLGLDEQQPYCDLEELINLVHPEDSAAAMQAATDYLNGKADGYRMEFRLLCHRNFYRWFLCRGTIVERSTDGKPIRAIGILSDISQSKNSELAIINARNEAERANRAKSIFLSSMSHELRTPMNSILGFSQLLEMDRELSDENQQFITEIRKAGNHLLDLINEVLDLAKVESGTTRVDIEPVTLQDLLQDIITLLKPDADRRRIALTIGDIGNAVVLADKVRLKQALINLISNAIKYNRDSGWVNIYTENASNDILSIVVEDNGVGIDEDHLNEVFEPFNRLGKEFSDIEGTGIGLALTRRLVEMMAGRIAVESERGVGSRFCINLPRSTVAEEKKPLAEPAMEYSVAHCVNKSNVLYIDDNHANQKLVKSILDTVPNIHLLQATNARLGLGVAEEQAPDLILLDINMPDINGYQLLDTLRRLPQFRHTPIVAVTANAMTSDIEKGIKAGFNDYLSKPFDINVFLSTVCKYLSNPETNSQTNT